jgi:hypothetical protein
VFKLKRDANGQIARYKARVVARGFTQEKGVDYQETFAPTVRVISIWTLLALAAYNDWEVEQLDMVTAFLEADIKEGELYVLTLYVDDIIIVGPAGSFIVWFKSAFEVRLNVQDLGPLSWLLGMTVVIVSTASS